MAYYTVPNEYRDCDDMLARLCEEGLARRIPDADDDTRARIQHELAIIKEKCIADYILTAWDIVKYAKEHGIYVGPGRGSSTCSLVNYLIGITDINPLKFGLPFARFVNIERRALVYMEVDVSNCEDLQPYIRLNSFPLHIDILKLGWLQVVKNTLDSLKMKGITLDINDIPLNDAETLNLFKRGETAGIFLFHSPHMRKYLCQMESPNFNDLVALNTLDDLLLDEKIPDYIERKRAVRQVDYFHPDLKNILSETHGLLIYQEQAMQIISKMTGFAREKRRDKKNPGQKKSGKSCRCRIRVYERKCRAWLRSANKFASVGILASEPRKAIQQEPCNRIYLPRVSNRIPESTLQRRVYGCIRGLRIYANDR